MHPRLILSVLTVPSRSYDTIRFIMAGERQEQSAEITRRQFLRRAKVGGALQIVSGVDGLYNVITKKAKIERQWKRDVPLALRLGADIAVFVAGEILIQKNMRGMVRSGESPVSTKNEQSQTPPQQ
jgi:hypothetical protein